MKNPNKTILFVEDDPIVLMVYRDRLEREGFHVECVGDGLAALEKIPQIKPGLVILDLMLPKLDGVEVLKFIRENADLKAMPVLVLSNAYMDDQAAKAVKAGANKGMLKTECMPAQLMGAVRELLEMEPAAGTGPDGVNRSEADPALVKADEMSLQQMRDELLKDAPGEIAKIRELCLTCVKTAGTPENSGQLDELYQRVRFLCGRAGLSGCTGVAHLAGAIEAMLFEIIFKSSTPSPSALQTVAQAVDRLDRLLEGDDGGSFRAALKARVLVVDDDPICNLATVAALRRARLEVISTQDPKAALKMAEADRYDIVLLDIIMPDLNGFEVCEKLRLLPDYKKTPVIFVTSNGEFQNRAKSVLSGGNDLIQKPVSPLELALKTIMHLIEPRGLAARPQAEMKTCAVTLVVPVPVEAVESKADSRGQVPAWGHPAHAAPRNAPPPPVKMTPPSLHFSAPICCVEERLPLNRINLPHNGANPGLFMKNRTEADQPFDKLTLEVARIIFGDDTLSEMNIRLTRIALERYNVHEIINRPETNGHAGGAAGHEQPFDQVTARVGKIFFGQDTLSEMNMRLTRIALERYNVPEIISRPRVIVALNDAAEPPSPALAIKF